MPSARLGPHSDELWLRLGRSIVPQDFDTPFGGVAEENSAGFVEPLAKVDLTGGDR